MKPNYSDILGRERPVHKNDDFDIRHPKMRRQLRVSCVLVLFSDIYEIGIEL